MDESKKLCIACVTLVGFLVGFGFGFGIGGGIWIPAFAALMVVCSIAYLCLSKKRKRKKRPESVTSAEETSCTTKETHTSKDARDIESAADKPTKSNGDPLFFHPDLDPDYDDVIVFEESNESSFDVSFQSSQSSMSTLDTTVKRDYIIPLQKVVEEGPRKAYVDPLHYHPKKDTKKTTPKQSEPRKTYVDPLHCHPKKQKATSTSGVSDQVTSNESSQATQPQTTPVSQAAHIVPLRKDNVESSKNYDDPLHYHPKAYPAESNVELQEVNDGSISDVTVHWIPPPAPSKNADTGEDPLYYDPALELEKEQTCFG